jgi:hypothetical protein
VDSRYGFYSCIYISLIRYSSTNPALQWDSWELNPKFFTALTRWTIDHPDTTLDGVLKNVCDAIDRGRDLLEVIPDAPFPARSLVKALGCLVKLGAVRHFYVISLYLSLSSRIFRQYTEPRQMSLSSQRRLFTGLAR